MRILQLSQFIEPVIGGEERHVQTLSECLVQRGHEVSLLTFATEADEGITFKRGVRIVRVRTAASRIPFLYTDRSAPHAMPIPDPAIQRAITAEIKRAEPEIVHAHNWIANSALRPVRRAGLPLLMTLHDYGQVCATQRLMEKNRIQCTGPRPVKCLACSAEKFGRLRGAATVLGNGVMSRRRDSDVTRFVSVSTAVADAVALDPAHRGVTRGVASLVIPNFIPDEQVLETVAAPRDDAPITFVGDLTRDKGVHVLLAAYERLGTAPGLQLVGRITPETPRDMPPGATATGPISHDRVLDIVRSGRFLVTPSTWQEPCPTVVLEGMAAGKPVVASAVGGIPDMVVPEETGLLVPPSDPGALETALRRLLDNPQQARAMGVAGRDRARQFTVSAVVDRLESLYLHHAASRSEPR